MRQRQEVQEVLPPLRIFPARPTESAARKLPYRPARSAATQIHGPHDTYASSITGAAMPEALSTALCPFTTDELAGLFTLRVVESTPFFKIEEKSCSSK